MKWLVVLVLCYSVVCRAEMPKVHLTSLEWPPYSGANLPENGYSVAIAREAFLAMGYALEVEFHPWPRAIAKVAKSEQFVGYFPEYEFATQEYVFSTSLGSGPLGFVENINKPIGWKSLRDIIPFRVGVVQDYINTPELDAMIAAQQLYVEQSANDLLNIYLVAKGRLDIAVIDANVLAYLVEADPKADFLRQQVKMNEKLLVEKQLHIAFKNTPLGIQWRDTFNRGLAQVDRLAVIERVKRLSNTTKN
ncbi:ABC transporter [Vibrio navarrensis]|uniref:substrate-binding periplasmic protein n=1 Tax=Vibrio navarrensis TaxID=29495 RepID=UPI001869A48F|nr:transporter substrate-binding domain-containing protein [Vibrio navarrensis]MBE3667963.1 ABC transporter [Vibrio navarrensis]MBE4591618.1 ABC transporter [Vibrio navarrensis]